MVSSGLVGEYVGGFADIDAGLARAFEDAHALLPATVSTETAREWCALGLQLARSFPGDSETASLWLAISPGLLDTLSLNELRTWTDFVLALGERSPRLAAAFIKASDKVLRRIRFELCVYWANMGLRLSTRGWKSIVLACDLFDDSEALLEVASTTDNDKLVDILCDVSDYSAELASSCLEAAPTVFELLPDENHGQFLELAKAVAVRSRADIWLYFERGPQLLEVFRLPESNRFVTLAVAIVNRSDSPPFKELSEISAAVSSISSGEHAALYDQAARVAERDAVAAAEFLKSAPRLRELVREDDMDTWVKRGLAAADQAGVDDERHDLRTFFAMESAYADQTLAELSGRIEFEREAHLLQLIGQALGGEGVHVQPIRSLIDKGLGWHAETAAGTDGRTIFVPAYVDAFKTRDANFAAYKVSIAHQSGRLQFGAFRYEFGADGRYLHAISSGRQPVRRAAVLLTPMQRFFDLFGDRWLIATLLSIVEDSRIDANVGIEYPGLAQAMTAVKAEEIRGRPLPGELPLRQAFLENLVRASLDSMETTDWPQALRAAMVTAIAVLRIAVRPAATVQDSAEIAAWLYDLAAGIPNLPGTAYPQPWTSLADARVPSVDRLPALPELPDEFAAGIASVPMNTVEAPGFRGEFKPELIQTLDALGGFDAGELDADALRDMVEHSVEIDGEGAAAEKILVQLAEEAGQEDVAEDDAEWAAGEIHDDDDTIDWYRYDEWDFRANDYLSGWCRVGERKVPEGDLAGYEDTLSRHHGLVLDIRRQFEMMRPESHRKIKYLNDGHEIDFEQAIQFIVDKKAGTGPTARFYSRRDKLERNVAVAFLLDLSRSTADLVRGSAPGATRRIIDVERDSTVLMMEALDAIGDAYGIFGFSGYGRRNVSFHVIKDMEELLGPAIKRRIDGIVPIRSTRMGAAIRHAVAKLGAYPANVRLLILVSDGRPQDQGYGNTKDNFDYGLHDTKQALTEAKGAGVVPFLITVDRDGPDYLREMCKDIGYEVVRDIESLPGHLPTIYRHLTRG